MARKIGSLCLPYAGVHTGVGALGSSMGGGGGGGGWTLVQAPGRLAEKLQDVRRASHTSRNSLCLSGLGIAEPSFASTTAVTQRLVGCQDPALVCSVMVSNAHSLHCQQDSAGG